MTVAGLRASYWGRLRDEPKESLRRRPRNKLKSSSLLEETTSQKYPRDRFCFLFTVQTIISKLFKTLLNDKPFGMTRDNKKKALEHKTYISPVKRIPEASNRVTLKRLHGISTSWISHYQKRGLHAQNRNTGRVTKSPAKTRFNRIHSSENRKANYLFPENVLAICNWNVILSKGFKENRFSPFPFSTCSLLLRLPRAPNPPSY